MADQNQNEYERGVAAGQVLARLDSHDQHLGKINGSMENVAEEMHKLNRANTELLLAIQRLADAAAADRATVVTTATALEKAEAARREKSVRRWTPVERLIGLVFAVVALVGLIAWAIVQFH
jgi:hypothetical protein